MKPSAMKPNHAEYMREWRSRAGEEKKKRNAELSKLRMVEYRRRRKEKHPKLTPRTLQDEQNEEGRKCKQRESKRQYRLSMSAQKKRQVNEKDAKRKRDKRGAIKDVEASSTSTAHPSATCPSAPVPVHLYEVNAQDVKPSSTVVAQPSMTSPSAPVPVHLYEVNPQDVKPSSNSTAHPSVTSPSAPVPVHLYEVNPQIPTDKPYVVVKTEQEPENDTNNAKESEIDVTSRQTTSATIRAFLRNKTPTVLLTNIKTEPVDFEDTTTPIPELETGDARPREVTHLSTQAVIPGGITPQTGITDQQHQSDTHERIIQKSAEQGRLIHLSFKSKNRTPLALQSRLSNIPAFQPKPEPKTVDVAVQTKPQFTHAATDTSDHDTGFDPSQLIILDPSRVIALDSSQVSGIQPSRIPGFNPAKIPGFDPSRIPGYDSSQEYRAVYVNWNEPLKGKTVDPMDEDLPQSSDQQPDVLSEPAEVQERACPSNSVTKTLDDVIRFTEFIQDARENVQTALVKLRTSQCTCRTKMVGFVGTLQKLLGLANNNVLHMISQLTVTVKQQQTQFLHIAQLVQRLQREQEDMEQQLLKSRKNNSDRKRSMANKIKFTGTSEPTVDICIKEKDRIDPTESQRNQNQNTKQNVNSKKKDNLRYKSKMKRKIDKQSQGKSVAFKRRKLGGLGNKRKQKGRLRPDTVKFLEEMRHVKGRRVTVSLIRRNPELCEKYTGFSNYSQLKEVFDKIVSDRHFITPTKDTGNSSVRKLSLESEFLITLVKIKLLVPLCYLCSQYKVSRGVVRETVVKWTGVLLETLRRVESESEKSSLQPLITITNRALNKLQNSGFSKIRNRRYSLNLICGQTNNCFPVQL